MPAITPEDKAREEIDKQLELAGWVIQNPDEVNLAASRGIAIREAPLNAGYGSADYLLMVDRRAVGVVEAKKVGQTLTQIFKTLHCIGMTPD